MKVYDINIITESNFTVLYCVVAKNIIEATRMFVSTNENLEKRSIEHLRISLHCDNVQVSTSTEDPRPSLREHPGREDYFPLHGGLC